MGEIKIVNINKGVLNDEYGNTMIPPSDWSFLAAGDAGITRKVTSKGTYWKVVFKKGKRIMSKGVWAPTQIINAAINEVNQIRSTDKYKKSQAYSKNRRELQQKNYELEFYNAIKKYLKFNARYESMEKILAAIITEYAIPVGSGTVARTKQIPIEERAKKAVLAWMRHQTSNYDNLKIPLIKGKRREVRRDIANLSINILSNYRKGYDIKEGCPLYARLNQITRSNGVK